MQIKLHTYVVLMSIATFLTACGGGGTPANVEALKNSYSQHTFVASDRATYQPELTTERRC